MLLICNFCGYWVSLFSMVSKSDVFVCPFCCWYRLMASSVSISFFGSRHVCMMV